MKLKKETIAAINNTLALMETNISQASLGARLKPKLDQTAMSGFIRGLRAHGADIPQKPGGRRPAVKQGRATTKAVIAAKATRKHTNGARAH